MVTVNVRDEAAHQRVVLAVGRVDEPGREAATAVRLIQQVLAVAGPGICAVVYDGAFRGTHHETLMTNLGDVVINKVHSARAASLGWQRQLLDVLGFGISPTAWPTTTTQPPNNHATGSSASPDSGGTGATTVHVNEGGDAASPYRTTT